MAEGLVNHFFKDRLQGFSAGIQPGSVHPLAVKVMEEIGIDISAHRSKHVREFAGREMDVVVTVCDNAREACPFFPGAKRYLHQGFSDPSAASGSESEKENAFRATRDEIRYWLMEAFKE